MVSKRDSKVERSKPAPYKHGAESLVLAAEPMGDSDQDAPAYNAYGYPARRPDPIIIDRIFYEEADSQHQYADTDLAHQVLANEFLPI